MSNATSAYRSIADLVRSGERIVISCSSHRCRSRCSVGQSSDAIACYSFHRAAKGGYYAVTPEHAARLFAGSGKHARTPGVTKLRGPYDDLLRCHQ